jgi:putative peptide zinc metalloprotease protein
MGLHIYSSSGGVVAHSALEFDPVEQQIRLLRSVPAFATLAQPVMQQLLSGLGEEAYPAGAIVIDEDQAADRLFLIAEGEVEVSQASGSGHVPLSRLSDGELFGEVGLLSAQRRRSARVTVTRPLLVSTLSHGHLNRLMEAHPEVRAALAAAAEQALAASLIKRASPFERLGIEALRWLRSRLETQEFPAGAIVFRQGEPGDVCYLVRAGEVEVVREEGGRERSVAVLGKGEIVGEAALLTGARRDATLRARPATLLALRRADLMAALKREEWVGPRLVELMRQHERPIRRPEIVAHPRVTADGDTFWLLEDPSRLGTYWRLSFRGFYAWNRLDGRHTAEEIAAEHRSDHGPVDAQEFASVMAELVSGGFAVAKEIRQDVATALTDRSLLARLRRFFVAA